MTLDELQSRLTAHFARRAPGHAAPPLGPLEELGGGWASTVYTFTLPRVGPGGDAATTVVLKLYAPDADGRQHATREWRALTHLRATGYRVPGVIAFEPDPRHLGRPFLVMDHVAGASFWSVYEAADPIARAQLTQSFVERLVALHALDPQLLELAAAPTPPCSHLDHELACLRRDGDSSPHTTLMEVVRWLEERKGVVSCEQAVILHRDYHPWNVMTDAADRLWVLDWDWQIGDARSDLAWTCTLMQRSGHHAFSGAVREEYARQSDRRLDDFAYFEVLTTVRWLLNVLPAVGPESRLGASARADFQSFLVEPLRQAQALLHDRTGITVTLQV